MSQWKKFRSLSLLERTALCQALVLLPLTAAALRLLGFRRLQSLMLTLGIPAHPLQDAGLRAFVGQAYGVARMVKAAAREGICRGSCLEQSLVLWWLLLRRGARSEVRIGARKEGNHFEAHAWVEFSGVVVNDSDDVHKHYTTFDGSIIPIQAEPR